MPPHAVTDFKRLPDQRLKTLVDAGFFQHFEKPISNTPNILVTRQSDDFQLKGSHLHERIWRSRLWTTLGNISEAKFFQLDDGTVISAKPGHLYINIPPNLTNLNHKITLPCHNPIHIYAKLLKRRILMEHIRGVIYTNDPDRPYVYLSKLVQGDSLREIGPQLSNTEKTKVAKNIGQRLAKVHKQDCVHCHPHSSNWIITDRLQARLIDQKLVHFRDDFPLTTEDKTISYEFMQYLDRHMALEAIKETLGIEYWSDFLMSYTQEFDQEKI